MVGLVGSELRADKRHCSYSAEILALWLWFCLASVGTLLLTSPETSAVGQRLAEPKFSRRPKFA